MDRIKAHLVVKGYTQIYGPDYYNTFSLVAKMAFVRLLLSIATMRSWPQYQLDIKKNFSMVTSLRRYIWSNHLDLLLRGSLVWYAGYAIPYMA